MSTFSADPSLIAFSKLYCDSPGRRQALYISFIAFPSSFSFYFLYLVVYMHCCLEELVLISSHIFGKESSLFFLFSCDPNFKEFCLQVLYECVSKDRPALLQVFLLLFKLSLVPFFIYVFSD